MNTLDAAMFKDRSIFQGWKEFDTPTGPMRAEKKSDRIWCVFEKSDQAFICVGTFATRNNSCKEIWEAAREGRWVHDKYIEERGADAATAHRRTRQGYQQRQYKGRDY